MLNKPHKWLKLKEKHPNRSEKHHNGLREPINNVNVRLVVKQTNSKVTTSSSDLPFYIKGVYQVHTYCEDGMLHGRGHFQ